MKKSTSFVIVFLLTAVVLLSAAVGCLFMKDTVSSMDGKRTDYHYSLDLDLGHIGIGGQQYAVPHQNQSIDNGAEKAIHAGCAMGSIGILFSEAD